MSHEYGTSIQASIAKFFFFWKSDRRIPFTSNLDTNLSSRNCLGPMPKEIDPVMNSRWELESAHIKLTVSLQAQFKKASISEFFLSHNAKCLVLQLSSCTNAHNLIQFKYTPYLGSRSLTNKIVHCQFKYKSFPQIVLQQTDFLTPGLSQMRLHSRFLQVSTIRSFAWLLERNPSLGPFLWPFSFLFLCGLVSLQLNLYIQAANSLSFL